MTVPTPDTLKQYLTHFRQRQMSDKLLQQQRYQQGWEQAKIAANLLKEQYRVQRVLLFGSLLASDMVHANSDIDLAVLGLPLEHYSEAIGTLLVMVKYFSVDLVRLETAQPELKELILQTGVEL